MTWKRWIAAILIFTALHGALTHFLTPVSSEIIWSRFDGDPYQSPLDPLWGGLYLLLHIPYYLLSYILGWLRPTPGIYLVIWAGNSLAWGLLGAWMVSKLPFLQYKEPGIESDPI